MAELLWTAGFDREFQETFETLEELSPGSGERFIRTLDEALGILRQYPESAPAYRGEFRRLVLRTANCGVFYRISGDRVVLIALLHFSFSRETILRRLGENPNRSG